MKTSNYFLLVALIATTIFSACKPVEPKNEPKTETFTVDGVSFKMVEVKAGTFTMGYNAKDTAAFGGSINTHQVTLTNDYYVGQTTVTVGLFRKFIEATGYKTEAETNGGAYVYVDGSWQMKSDAKWNNTYFVQTDNSPVVCVSWNDAVAFCTWLSTKTGKTFRLLTEAEWEYAARGGNQSKGYLYSGSDSINDVAWYWKNWGEAEMKTHEVGKKQANELGIYDMSGNVWEWCNDWYAAYTSEPQTDPQGAVEGSGRVDRGGSWLDNAQSCRVSCRTYITPGLRSPDLGFRIARSSK